MADKRKCLCCETTYEYCPSCGKSSTPWKVNFDTEACKELFNAVSAYNMNLVKEDEIKKVLDKYSISDYSKYKESIRTLLNKLFSNKSVPVVEEVIESRVEEPIQEETPAEEIPVIEEPKIEDAPRNRRRNRFFE